MTPRATTYQTDEPCPSCGEPLTVADDGDNLARAECRACGHAEHWLFTDYSGGGNW